MPNVMMMRPADANEVAAVPKVTITSEDRPTLLALTRQDVLVLPNMNELAQEYVQKGGYVLSPAEDQSDGILMATGSEVQLAVGVKGVKGKQLSNILALLLRML